MTAVTLSVDDLAQRCAEETDKFNRRQPNDAQFCFELLRRAFAEGVDDALTHVFQIYEQRVLSWVRRHSRFEQTGEDADFFARAAMSTFYFALRGAKFERFPSLPHVLSYLNMCVHTTIAQYIRDQQPGSALPYDAAPDIAETPDLGTRADAAELWAHICRLLPEERDRLLARCAFLLDLKPRQIVTEYRTHWSSEREISVALYRIRRVLRNDPELRRRAGLAADGAAAAE